MALNQAEHRVQIKQEGDIGFYGILIFTIHIYTLLKFLLFQDLEDKTKIFFMRKMLFLIPTFSFSSELVNH